MACFEARPCNPRASRNHWNVDAFIRLSQVEGLSFRDIPCQHSRPTVDDSTETVMELVGCLVKTITSMYIKFSQLETGLGTPLYN